MIAAALSLSLALLAQTPSTPAAAPATAPAPASTPTPHFIPPKTVPLTDQLKCDTGTVVAVAAAVSQLRVNTPAGLVIYMVSPSAQVLTFKGAPSGTVANLQSGTKIRIYYVIDNGARVSEISLD